MFFFTLPTSINYVHIIAALQSPLFLSSNMKGSWNCGQWMSGWKL